MYIALVNMSVPRLAFSYRSNQLNKRCCIQYIFQQKQ